jgi:hypothetical protein
LSTEPHRINVHYHIFPPDYLSSNPNALRSLQELVDASRILIGSDYPFAARGGYILAVQGMQNFNGFDEQTRIAVERESTRALFPCFK